MMTFAALPSTKQWESCRQSATPNVPENAVVRLGRYMSDDRLRRDLSRALRQPTCITVTAEWNGVPLILTIAPTTIPSRVLCNGHAAVVVIDRRLSSRERNDHLHSAIDYIQHLRAKLGRTERV
jgi:hypothetical protein